jgi:hypothetical protein
VDSAKRAINLIRALTNVEPAESNVSVQLLAKAARNIVVAAVRQSPAFPIRLVAIIVLRWGKAKTWWKRQIALMILIAVCTFGRGAEMCACLRRGIEWVAKDGSIIRGPITQLQRSAGPGFSLDRAVRGFLILFSTRKNRLSTPSWVPVAEKSAINLLAIHLAWLSTVGSKSPAMFLARRVGRSRGARVYLPNTSHSSEMSTDTFRTLIRAALTECCKFSPTQAKEFGTHSCRLAAMELMRRNGVPAELRQQMGDWMSERVVLRYLQLNTDVQFNIIEHIS